MKDKNTVFEVMEILKISRTTVDTRARKLKLKTKYFRQDGSKAKHKRCYSPDDIEAIKNYKKNKPSIYDKYSSYPDMMIILDCSLDECRRLVADSKIKGKAVKLGQKARKRFSPKQIEALKAYKKKIELQKEFKDEEEDLKPQPRVIVHRLTPYGGII